MEEEIERVAGEKDGDLGAEDDAGDGEYAEGSRVAASTWLRGRG